ncbi:MAG: NTP transferase domain-containing protein [bacterium]|nr:MAG: NTP transferase domain-containing protein [bacterium]
MTRDRNLVALVLAAGEGTRMKSPLAKVLHTVCGRPMIRYVLDTVRSISPARILVVVGHQADAVREELTGEAVEFVIQTERLGTGHAVMMAEPALRGYSGTIIALNGDTPLLKPATLDGLLQFHWDRAASATVLSALLDDPQGYGRIVRDDSGRLLRIVEHRDATEAQRSINEINSGIFCFESDELFETLPKLSRRNVQGEYYITDVIELLREQGAPVAIYRSEQKEEVLGINDTGQLEAAERSMIGDGQDIRTMEE